MFKRTAITVILALLMVGDPLFAADFRICEDCHFERLEADRGRYYQHQAFVTNDCASCHVRAPETSTLDRPAAAPPPAQQQRISWMTDSVLPGTSHYFLLAAEGLRETLVVSLRDHLGQMHREDIPLPPLEQLAAAPDDGRTPHLTNVRVVEVKRGVFLSVAIAWQTDVLATAEVRYGTAELNRRNDSVGRLGFEHQLILNQLEPNKTYRYQVISRDLSGREAVSEVLTFSTAREIARRQDNSPAIGAFSAPAVMVDLRRRGDDYLLEVHLDQPRVVSIGSKGGPIERPREADNAMNRNRNRPHAGLSDEGWSSMESCRQCHEKNVAASHPVNVLPPSGMIIPPEYPTLADGRMTCASCHAIHGSDQEYMTRQRSKRELCVGCHLDML
ncbi:cytochrome c3 family protein [Pelovirga terrestris]|uniref:Fibronectin type III domain-containing protein n=1 Tax=Pelovirga terrestris TaxID=2771352 RepID=A0A8J6QYB0_9BACT|nr:cytochrome c3 family protein [Pelovirga terrestris]MBD1401088.1 fibronectin type III domain-containing protein [Pelovirga terrestris]